MAKRTKRIPQAEMRKSAVDRKKDIIFYGLIAASLVAILIVGMVLNTVR